VKRFLQAVLVAGMVCALAGPVFAGSVLDALTAGNSVVGFSPASTTYAHQDMFATSPVTAAGAGEIASGSAVVSTAAGNPILRATLLANSILYGGSVARFNINATPVVTSNELTFAFGNLYETVVPYAAGDLLFATGAVGTKDSLTGAVGAGTGKEYKDNDGDGFIEIGSIFDLDGTYGDYNRDGVTDAKDRPFLAIFEDTTPDFTVTSTPADFDDGGAGPRVDGYWVGDPLVPVDIAADANGIRESRPELTDYSFGGLLALFVFDTVPTGKKIATTTVIDVNDPFNSTVNITGSTADGSAPAPGTNAQVQLIGGRLFSILAGGSNKIFKMEGHYTFDPTDGSDVTMVMEFHDSPTIDGKITVIPEPASIALLLSSVLGLGGVRVWRRKK